MTARDGKPAPGGRGQSGSAEARSVHLFFGYGSEYSLHDLYTYMAAKGDPCIEVDMLIHPDVVGALRGLDGRVATFVTSAHLLYDARNFFFYRTERTVISPLHVISTLAPAAAVYYPHDLKDPVKPEEEPYLPLFDLLLSPLPALDRFNAYLPVRRVGWIKRSRKPDRVMPPEFNPGRAVFFTGAFQYYLNRGFQSFYDEFKPLFDAGIAVKFPVWHEAAAFEEFLRARGVGVYPSSSNSIHVMEENEVIFTQALSSVGIEACLLGRRVCYIRDTVLDYEDPVMELGNAGAITFVDTPEQAAALAPSALPKNPVTMDYFDFEGARRAILDVAREAGE